MTMTKETITHPELVATLVKKGEDILNELTTHDAFLLNFICQVVICGGNLLDTIKKRLIYRKEILDNEIQVKINELKSTLTNLQDGVNVPSDKIYQLNVDRLGSYFLKNLTPETCHLIHMAIGIAGEGAELLEAITDHVIKLKPLDISNVAEELGDGEFYNEGVRQALNLVKEEILQGNIDKLTKRYHQLQYTNEQAVARKDKE